MFNLFSFCIISHIGKILILTHKGAYSQTQPKVPLTICIKIGIANFKYKSPAQKTRQWQFQ